MDETIFKAYDIRGIYGEQFNEDDAWKIGCAAGRFLPSLMRGYDRAQAPHICVGYDMRPTSPTLAKALTKGIRSTGVGVINIGMVDTPQVYYAINHLKTCGGIQVTASHNPIEYNGFKISGQFGIPIGIDTGLVDIQHLASSLLHTKGNLTGPTKKVDLADSYKQHILKFLTPQNRKLRIAIDASNGMAGPMIPVIFGDLPVDIIPLNFEVNGTFQHDPNPLVEANLWELKQAVQEHNCDCGLCFDGDADRLIMIDEKGNSIGCDLLTASMAPYFLEQAPYSTVVYDLRSSLVVQEEVIKHGGTPRRERVGHAFMKKAMRDSHAVFGGELSGHFYYRDNFSTDSGFITLVHLLNILNRIDQPVSDWMAPLNRYHNSGELNFAYNDIQEILEILPKRFHDGEIDQLDGITIRYKEWWFNCRPSHTEPYLRLTLEAKSRSIYQEHLSELKALLGEPI